MMLACLCRWRRRPYCLLSAEMSSVMRACSARPSWAAPRGGFAERAPFLRASGDESVPPSRGTDNSREKNPVDSIHVSTLQLTSRSHEMEISGTCTCSSAKQQSQVAANVNKYSITRVELETAYENARRRTSGKQTTSRSSRSEASYHHPRLPHRPPPRPRRARFLSVVPQIVQFAMSIIWNTVNTLLNPCEHAYFRFDYWIQRFDSTHLTISILLSSKTKQTCEKLCWCFLDFLSSAPCAANGVMLKRDFSHSSAKLTNRKGAIV